MVRGVQAPSRPRSRAITGNVSLERVTSVSKGAVARKEHRTAEAPRGAGATTLRRSNTWSPGSFRRALLLSRGSRGDRRGSARCCSSMTAEQEQAATRPRLSTSVLRRQENTGRVYSRSSRDHLQSWAQNGRSHWRPGLSTERHRWDSEAGGARRRAPQGCCRRKAAVCMSSFWPDLGQLFPEYDIVTL